MESSQPSPEEQERLLSCKLTAQHMADAVEQAVFQMLSERAVTADAISPSLGLGVLVGPAWFVQMVKASMAHVIGPETQASPMSMRTSPRHDPDSLSTN